MYSVSDRFLPALATSHSVVTRVDVTYDGATVAEDIPILDGSVAVDRGADCRRSLSLSIAENTIGITPYGYRIHVQQGIRYIDGSTELVSVGYFIVESVAGDVHSGPIDIVAPGLESAISAEPFGVGVSTSGAITAAGFISAQLLAVDPSISFVDLSTGGVDPLPTVDYDPGADRWDALVSVGQSVGAELYANADGTFVLVDAISDPGAIDWSVEVGEGGVMVAASASQTLSGVYNRVLCYGENAADGVAPVWAEAVLDDPADPLRYGGPIGRRTRTMSSDLWTTTGRAQAAANAQLRALRGPTASVSLSTVPNPALEAGDTIRTVFGQRPSELYVVESFSLPLGVSSGEFVIETSSGEEAT